MSRHTALAGACALLGAFASPAASQDIPPANCSHVFTGLTPLHDLGTGTYQGFEGGLYPGGVNMRPAAHDLAGIQLAESLEPLDAAGQPDPNGKIVMVGFGPSLAKQYFHAVKLGVFDADPLVAGNVEFVNAGKSAQGAVETANPLNSAWFDLANDLAAAGSSFEQVQLMWLHTVTKYPSEPFPQHAMSHSLALELTLENAKDYMPNLKIAYLTSRVYGDYWEDIPVIAEPYAYESGFGTKWLIEEQINGEPDLNWNPANGPAVVPWLAWGPYLWADGIIPRSDGLTWNCSDFGFDGLHPDVQAKLKMNEYATRFFHTDATARLWYLGDDIEALCSGQATVVPIPDSSVAPTTGTAPRLAISDLPTVPSEIPLRAFAFDGPPSAQGFFRVSSPNLPGLAPARNGGPLGAAPYKIYSAPTDAMGHAALELGALPSDPSTWCSLELTVQYFVQDGAGWARTDQMKLTTGH